MERDTDEMELDGMEYYDDVGDLVDEEYVEDAPGGLEDRVSEYGQDSVEAWDSLAGREATDERGDDDGYPMEAYADQVAVSSDAVLDGQDGKSVDDVVRGKAEARVDEAALDSLIESQIEDALLARGEAGYLEAAGVDRAGDPYEDRYSDDGTQRMLDALMRDIEKAKTKYRPMSVERPMHEGVGRLPRSYRSTPGQYVFKKDRYWKK